MNRSFLFLIGYLGLSVLLLSSCSQNKKKNVDKPNVLFIAVDDLRPQTNCYGKSQMVTPNIDQLAGNGVQFNRAYCNVPVCGASRASLLSGIRPARDRFVTYYTRLDEDAPGVVTLPEHFKNHGYYTISNGKVFHHSDDGIRSWSEPAWNASFKTWRDYEKEENIKLNQIKSGPPFEKADVADTAYRDGKIATKTIEDLHRLAKMDKPFFLAAGFLKPHLPFNAPSKYWELYKREEITKAPNPYRPENAPDAAMHNWGELRQYHQIPKKGPVSDSMAIDLIHGYYACVSYTDAQIGKIIDELDKLGLRENTVIILWGDHGWHLGEHGLWCKHCNFEKVLHVPMIISAPGYKTNVVTHSLVEYIDIYPTLCELAGLHLPEQLDGKSMVPILNDPNKHIKDAVFSRWYDGETVITPKYAYTEWRDSTDHRYAHMLYDHTVDREENYNIAGKEDNLEITRELSQLLEKIPNYVNKE